MTRAVTHGLSQVHKFDVAILNDARMIGGPTVLPLCPSARVVHVAKQRDGLFLQLWAVVPVDGQGRAPFSGDGRRFEVYGTGHDVPGSREHVGTVLDGPFVWHVFEDVSERVRRK